MDFDMPDFTWRGVDVDAFRRSINDNFGNFVRMLGVSDSDSKQIINALSGVPVLGDYFQWSDRMQSINDYMDNTGLDWGDVKYPTMIAGGQHNLYNIARSGTNFVSSNIKKLYSD